MLTGLGNTVTLTWKDEEGEERGVSAPIDLWVSQLVIALPQNIRISVMDAVVAEVSRLNEIQEDEPEEVEDDQEEE